jgi:sugar transferase EpsL
MHRNGFKRLFDVLIVLAIAPVALPVSLLVAVLIRYGMGKPVLFRHRRPGLNERPFTLLKFRTMLPAVDGQGRRLSESERVPRLGALLRKTSLDELPQLWNVLRGDMSIIGPRPLLEDYLAYYTAHEHRRHSVRPGITGWAQVNGRNFLPANDRLAMDVWYVDHQSWVLDIYILLRTISQVIACRNVEIAPPADATESFFAARSRTRQLPEEVHDDEVQYVGTRPRQAGRR